MKRDNKKGKVAWWVLSELKETGRYTEGEHDFCQAPRHIEKSIPAVYVLLCMPWDEPEPIIQGMCYSCTDIIARDLGTTAFAAVLPAPPA